jgi:hypothetical protein
MSNTQRKDVTNAAFAAVVKPGIPTDALPAAVNGIVKVLSESYKETDTIFPGEILVKQAKDNPSLKSHIVDALRTYVAKANVEKSFATGIKAEMTVPLTVGEHKGEIKVSSEELTAAGKIGIQAYRCIDIDANTTTKAGSCISVLYNGAHGGDTTDEYTISIPFASLDGCKILKKADELSEGWTEDYECDFEEGTTPGVGMAKYRAKKFSIIRVEFAETSGALVWIVILLVIIIIAAAVWHFQAKIKGLIGKGKSVKEIGFASVANPLSGNVHVQSKDASKV